MMSEVSRGQTDDTTGAAEAVERELVMLFRRVRSVAPSLAAEVHPELDPASYRLLLTIDDVGSLSSTDVAARTGLDKSTVSRQIARLTELDLLEQAPDSIDRRVRRLRLSGPGKARLAVVRQKRLTYLHAEFAHWTTADLATFARLLDKFNQP